MCRGEVCVSISKNGYIMFDLIYPETSKCGIIETDENGIISSFLEKPLPTATKSRKAVS